MAYTIKITPRAERLAVIKNRLKHSEENGEAIYDFRSDIFTPPVIKLPIEMPVYRMENCRTFSAQQSEIATQGLDKNFFAKGQESTVAQRNQHNILKKLAKLENESVTSIFSVLDKDGQREPLLISSSGVVINGNRRLSAMRELYLKKDGTLDQRFSHIRCAVLPADATADEIDDIEADLQARPQTKLDYDWIGDARLIRRQVDKGRTTQEVASRLRRRKIEIENVLQALDEADLYLCEWIEKPGHYHLLKDGEQLFGDIPKNIAKKEAMLQDASRAIAWTVYENRDRIEGRVYSLNSAFGRLAPTVLDILENQIEISPDDESSSINNDEFSIEIAPPDDGVKNYSGIIKALKNEETKEEVVPILLEACETAIQLDKGQKNEQAALKTLSQVNAKITSIQAETAGIKTLPAMLKQIETIRNGLKKIELAIKARQGSKSEPGNAEK